MRIVVGILKRAVILFVIAVAGVAGWLYFVPPELIRVGTGYTAKIVCSNVFIAGRDPQAVLAVDVQAPGHPLLGYIGIDVDEREGVVSAGLLGIFGQSRAVRREGLGCASIPEGAVADVTISATPGMAAARQSPWPRGDLVDVPENAELATILDDPAMTGPGMRAVVVVHDGRIVGERYGEGFDAATPLLGWSMTKTVNAAIVGTLVQEGKLAAGQRGLFDHWGQERAEISLADMLGMVNGLEFNEDYGDVTDVTRMLYLEPDMAAFASSKPAVAEPGSRFNYSSGTAVMISRIWQDALGEPQDGFDWPREALFDPLGMESAVMETDALGTFVGSSYMYANARDWARFGQFLLQEGEWEGRQILPAGYVEWMRQSVPASDGEYGKGQVWLHGPTAGTPEGEDPDAGFTLPDDAFWALGHDGQSLAMIPSEKLVVVRLGLTPSKLGYKPQALVQALARVLEPALNVE